MVTTNTYSSSRGWLDSIANTKNSTELSPWSYTRRLSGAVETETTTGRTRTFTYDGAGRLARNVEGARNYYYDANSNRCSTTAPCNANPALDAYQYDNADRLLTSPFASTYTYDAHGNITAANVTTPSVPGSLNQPASFDAGYSLAPQSFPFLVGQNGTASAQYAWTANTPVNRSGTYTGVLGAAGSSSSSSSSSPMLFDGEAYGTASLSWPRDTHQVHPTFTTSVSAQATNSHSVSPNTSGTISASLDWNPTSTSQTWNSSVGALGTTTQSITASSSGALTASLTWSAIPNPDLDLYLKDGATVLASSTNITGNSESVSYTVPSSVTYTAKKTYTLEVKAKAAGSAFTLSSTWPVTPELDLELWSGSTKVDFSYSTSARPESVSASGPAGTYTWKVISRDYAVSYTLTTTHNQLDYADLTFSLKDSTGTVVASAPPDTPPDGSLTLAGYLSSSGGQDTLNVVNNSTDLGVPAPGFTLPWSTTTLGEGSASGTVPASSSVVARTESAEGSGYAQGTVTWPQTPHLESFSSSGTVPAQGTDPFSVPQDASGTLSTSVSWQPTTVTETYSDRIDANANNGGTCFAGNQAGALTARVNWGQSTSQLTMDLIDHGTLQTLASSLPSGVREASLSYTVPSSVTYETPKAYCLVVTNVGLETAYAITYTRQQKATVRAELWLGANLVKASTYDATSHAAVINETEPAGAYTMKIISSDYAAAWSASTTSMRFVSLTETISGPGGFSVSQSSSSGVLSLTTSLPASGTYTFTLRNNSPVSVSYGLSTVFPKRHGASARLEIQNSSGTPLGSASGAGTLNVTANIPAAGSYYVVLTPLTGAGSGTITGTYPGRVPAETIAYDGNDHATVINDGTATVTETLAPSGRVLRRRVVDNLTADVLEDTVFGYDDDGDSPSYARPYAGGATTTYLEGPGGLLVIDTAGVASYPIQNGHGDIVGTTNTSGTFSTNPVTDEFGVGEVPASRLGWLGGKERFATGGTLKLIRMGVRLYDPKLGRFLGVDPVEGGSANDYDYANQEPCNTFDLDGNYAAADSGGGGSIRHVAGLPKICGNQTLRRAGSILGFGGRKLKGSLTYKLMTAGFVGGARLYLKTMARAIGPAGQAALKLFKWTGIISLAVSAVATAYNVYCRMQERRLRQQLYGGYLYY